MGDNDDYGSSNNHQNGNQDYNNYGNGNNDNAGDQYNDIQEEIVLYDTLYDSDDSEYVDPFNPPNLDTGNAFPNYNDYEQNNDYNKDYTNNIGDYEEQYDDPDYGSQQQTIE